jgi:cytoskeletal protein RodZ
MTSLAADAWSVESIRKAKGISLEEISNETKLKLATLQAIEIGNFDALPGGIYNISYIRQYARAIGADEADLVQFYRAKCSSAATEVIRFVSDERKNTGGEICQLLRQLLQTRPLRRAQ